MAKYRVRWRNILRNMHIIIMLVEAMRWQWPKVKAALKTTVAENPDVADFISAGDTVYQILIERRR